MSLKEQEITENSKIDDYFKRLSEIVQNAKKESLEKLDRIIEKQKHEFINKIKVEDVRRRISEDKHKINVMAYQDDQELIKWLDGKGTKILNSRNRYFKKLDIPQETCDIKFKESLLPRIEELIKKSYDFTKNSIKKNEVKDLKEKLIKVKSTWYCHSWYHANKNNKRNIECKKWGVYRPLISFQSFFRNKAAISSYDLKLLVKRREAELKKLEKLQNKIVRGFKKNEEMKHDINASSDSYYFINTNWYDHWQAFVFNERENVPNTVHKSHFKEVGVLDPGPINNWNLVDEEGMIKLDLVLDSDYKIIPQEIWKFVWTKYGGGPIIKRAKKNIYSEPLPTIEEQEEHKAKLQEIFKQRDKQNNKMAKKKLLLDKNWSDISEDEELADSFESDDLDRRKEEKKSIKSADKSDSMAMSRTATFSVESQHKPSPFKFLQRGPRVAGHFFRNLFSASK